MTADCGGSNGNRVRLWKRELQALASEIGLTITVCHFPPGTSKWNKIEHRMFCHISENWRARPLTSLGVVVSLIGSTTTQAGLKIRAAADLRKYPLKVKVSDEEMRGIRMTRPTFRTSRSRFPHNVRLRSRNGQVAFHRYVKQAKDLALQIAQLRREDLDDGVVLFQEVSLGQAEEA